LAPPFPWVYPYEEDGPRLNSVILRPIVPVSVVGREVGTPVLALVDSGCEHVLAAPWVAAAAGVDTRDSHKELTLGLGGESVQVRFLDLRLRLHPPGEGNDDVFVEWEDEVGFLSHWRPTWPVLLGQTGFMKRFTVVVSRLAQAVAIEDAGWFDGRYPAPLAR
jgi:hypothetical protein